MEFEWINPRAARWLAIVGFVAAALILVLGILAALVGWRLNEAALQAISLLGVAVSVTAVALALVIYLRQEVSTGEQFGTIAEMVRVLPQALAAPQTLAELAAAQDDDDYPEDTAVAESVGTLAQIPGRSDVRLLNPQDVPLSVLADLVGGWRHANVGKDGNWTVGNLVGAGRSVGQGNHPWYLVFRSSGGDVIWRLYRGKK